MSAVKISRLLAAATAVAWCTTVLAQAQIGAPTERTELNAVRQARDALIAAADFAGALQAADRGVELAATLSEPDYYEDLLRLARIQAELGELESAETSYLEGIAILEQREGQNSMALIEPYQGLGRTYVNNRMFSEAITVLEHARDISQRNTGLFNVEQSELIDDITMALLGQGATQEARRLQLERLENAVRRFGEDDPQTVPFYQHLGEYYDNSRLRLSAREQYEKALAIQDSQADADPTAVLESLRKLVQVELLLGDSDEARLRLEQTLDEGIADPIERGLSLALLGDYAIVNKDFEGAAAHYASAYGALNAQDPAIAREYFAAPAMIDFIPPLNSVDRGRRSDPYAWGSIVLQFDVNAEGRAVNVRTAQIEPDNDDEPAYTRRVRETHFRPRLVDGTPVTTRNVEFSHFFRYYVRQRRR